MSASRKGLKRQGWHTYIITGPRKEMCIDRDGKCRFTVRPASFPARDGFFAQQFKRLYQARAYAESEAGVQIDLAACMPGFLRRSR